MARATRIPLLPTSAGPLPIIDMEEGRLSSHGSVQRRPGKPNIDTERLLENKVRDEHRKRWA